MQNIISDIVGYIESKVTLIATPVYYDMFATASGDAVMVRAIPGDPGEVRYFDGSRSGGFPFSVYARSANSETAYNQLCQIIAALDMRNMPLTDELRVSVVANASPALVQKVEGGDYTYTAGFRLDYFTEV